jgi:hypothetical protein
MFSGIVFALEINSEKKTYPTGRARRPDPVRPARPRRPDRLARRGPSRPEEAGGAATPARAPIKGAASPPRPRVAKPCAPPPLCAAAAPPLPDRAGELVAGQDPDRRRASICWAWKAIEQAATATSIPSCVPVPAPLSHRRSAALHRASRLAEPPAPPLLRFRPPPLSSAVGEHLLTFPLIPSTRS